jgi:hypothetical protein
LESNEVLDIVWSRNGAEGTKMKTRPWIFVCLVATAGILATPAAAQDLLMEEGVVKSEAPSPSAWIQMAEESQASEPEAPAADVPANSSSGTGYGMNPWAVGVLQTAAGCGLGFVTWPCNCCTCFTWNCWGLPLVVGITETYVGDLLGPSRAAMIGPIVAAYVAGLAGFFASWATRVILSGTFAVGTDLTNLNDPAALWAGQGLVQNVVDIAILVAVAATPAVVYFFMAEPKGPGDTGQGFPGFMSPAHPGAAPPAAPSQKAEETAMAF